MEMLDEIPRMTNFLKLLHSLWTEWPLGIVSVPSAQVPAKYKRGSLCLKADLNAVPQLGRHDR